jgi:hypothetical protein
MPFFSFQLSDTEIVRMININMIKAMLEFYLQTRTKAWGMTDINAVTLPKDQKTYEKVDYLCRLLQKIEACSQNKEELINLCSQIAKQEEKELNEHKSSRLGGYAGSFTDYPFMAITLKAIRSLITQSTFTKELSDSKLIDSLDNDIADLEKAQKLEKTKDRQERIDAKKTLQTLSQLANFHKSAQKDDFLHVVKYEDNLKGDRVYQAINSFDDFYTPFKMAAEPYPLLDKLYTEWKNKIFLITTTDLAPTLFNNLVKAGAPLSKKDKKLAERVDAPRPATEAPATLKQ